MNRAELIASVAKQQGFFKSEVEGVVNTVFDTIVDSISKGEDVKIKNFGVFKSVERGAKMARNPQTGEAVYVEPKSVPTFKPAKTFKEKVSGACDK